jgi:proline dehydrogenase
MEVSALNAFQPAAVARERMAMSVQSHGPHESESVSHEADGKQAEILGLSAGTDPPPLVGFRRLKTRAVERTSALLLPIMQRAARGHVGGETIEDALCVARRLADETTPCTLGYWNTADCIPRQVADAYLAAVEVLAASALDAYLSIKPPALRFDPALADELASAAQRLSVRLHFDSHGPEAADLSCDLLDTMLGRLAAGRLGATLPGRWSRSLGDAEWAIERGLAVRVVKGQWPDPGDPERDMCAGFLEVIDRLAGRARHVAVATHDAPLAAQAISRLRAAGTSCEIEQILGMSSKRIARVAREAEVRVRIYIPYGKAYLPNAIRVLMRNPRLALQIAKNFVAG